MNGHVSRLEEGDWVLFDAFSETPIRLKVGWVAKRKGKFVFVNVLGKKEKVLKSEELIELFKAGETLALDGAEEPAMDRAQYSMLQKLHKQLLFQSTHDQLTGLMNRREFEVCLEQAVDDAKIANTKHALCYIDLDKFSVINNSCGYEGGDALIKAIADILKKHLSENSALSRFSGDEFCMLLCGHGTDDALEVVENILEELNNYRFVWEDKRLSVAMSIGMVQIKGHGQKVIKLLQDAEASCGVAKEIGGHRVQVYHEGNVRLDKRDAEMKWAAKIDRALDNNSLHLRCQRIMPLAIDDSYHDHYEILLGITDDLGEQSELQQFIRAAENYKRMADIDRWVIKTAFKWIADHRKELDHVSSFSINLSGHSLNDLGLMEFVMKQMRNTNVPIGKICFEITETLGIASLSDAADFIKRFKTTGCMFSLDDFGSGMSSYGYLKSLPVDYLKIDGVFVKDMATNPNDYAVVKSINEIGHFMGKKIIAEYVQDDETIQLLKDLGVDYAQGYGIEKPRLLDDILR
jgi:diguanylate cyclase (GGDEF)-like protein